MKDKKPKPKEVLYINGLMDDDKIRWKKIPCVCSQDERDVTHRYPIASCIHCKFQECEDSLPREPFDVIDNKKGRSITRHITKIEIVRGKKYDDILGWQF